MNTKTLSALIAALEEFRKLDPEMQMQTALTFLYVAARGEAPMKDMADALGVSQSAVSRNVAALGEWHRARRPGYNLVVAEEDPLERRRKIVRLTAKGKRVAEALSGIFGK